MRTSILLAAFLVASLALGQKPTTLSTDGKKSGLSASQLVTLQGSKMRHLVPTFVPPGFKVSKFEFVKATEDEEAYWMIHYRNAKSKGQITVQMASDGFGDPILSDDDGNVIDSKVGPAFKSPVFGSGRLYVAKSRKWNGFASDWIDLKVKSKPTHVMIYGQRADPQLGKKILESLRWLR